MYLTEIVKIRCDSNNEISEEIQLAVIKLAKILPDISLNQ